MRKIIKKNSLQACMDLFQYIIYSCYYTDVIMYKQGKVYELESYQKRTIVRFKYFFSKLKKVIETTEKEELLKTLREKNENYLQQYYQEIEHEKVNKIKRVFTPESKAETLISVKQGMFWKRITKVLEKNEEKVKEKWNKIVEIEYDVLNSLHKDFRKDLKKNGYEVVKEKKLKMKK